MKHATMNYILILLCGIGTGMALGAPDLFAAQDAAPEAATAAPAADVSPAPALPPAAETPAAATEAPDTSAEAASAAVEAVSQGVSGKWWAMASTIVLLLVWLLRWMLGHVGAFRRAVMETDIGGPLFTVAVAFLVALSTPLASGPPSLAALKAAGLAAVLAIGGWHGAVKRILMPIGRWLWAKVS